MKKFNILYIGLAIVFFVASLLIMKIPGDSGLNRNDDTSTDEISATMEEKNDTEKDINEIGMETDTNSSTQKESESEIESSEVVSEMKSETETEVETLSEEEIKKQEIEDYLKNTNFSALIDFKAEKPYMIMVNRACNCVTVYGIDFHGEYTVPYKTMTCSTGLYQGNTPLGEYYISDKYNWRMMIDASFAQYAVRFNGGVMFHSVPYHTMNKGDMEWEEYNKLGEPASLGCVRLRVEDAKWIYDNCPKGTRVTVYDDENNPGELGKNEIEKMDENMPFKGWDPTDPDENNPWNQITGK